MGYAVKENSTLTTVFLVILLVVVVVVFIVVSFVLHVLDKGSIVILTTYSKMRHQTSTRETSRIAFWEIKQRNEKGKE